MASTIRQRTEQRRFGPKEATHPSVGQPCAKCKKPLAAGDYTTLLPVKSTDISPNVTIVEADEAHWDCVVPAADSLVTAIVSESKHPAYEWLDVFSHGERAGTLVVRKGDGGAIADRLLSDYVPPKSEKPVAPPPPLGDWRTHLRYALDYEPTTDAPKMPPEIRRELFRTLDGIDTESAIGITTNMLHQWSSVLEILQRHARGAKLTSEQAAIAKNIEEGVRRATVAFLAIVAERSRSYS